MPGIFFKIFQWQQQQQRMVGINETRTGQNVDNQ